MEKKKKYTDKELLLNFDFDDIKSDVKPKLNSVIKTNKLQIVKSKKQVLSKNQQNFNKLIKKIEALEKQIVDTKNLAFELTIAYSKEISPVQKTLGKAYFEFATILDSYVQNIKLTNRQNDDFENHIMDLFNIALTYTEPNEQEEALYNKYGNVSYKEMLEVEKLDLFEQFRDFMEDEMGVDVGDMDFDMSNEEEARKYAEKLKEQLDKKNQEEEEIEQNKKKTKKQIEEEQKQKLEDELSKKSLRSIYISLAKMLHPDTEINEDQKAEKTELMKKVTVAYDQKDLATLLKLEMEWVNRTADDLQKLTDGKLKLYNKVLSEQVDELEEELCQLKMNPAYTTIFELLNYSSKYAHTLLKTQKKEILSELEGIKSKQLIFQKKKKPKSVLIKYLEEVSELEDDFDEFDDYDVFGDEGEGEDDDVFGEMLYNLMSGKKIRK
jgi:hypothetical protein